MELNATISEIAAALGKTDRAIRKRRDSQGWTPVNDKGVDRFAIDRIGLSVKEVAAIKKHLRRNGAGKNLPAKSVDKALAAVLAEQPVPAALPVARPDTAVAVATPKALPALAELKKWQRETMEARIFFLRLIERAVAEGMTLKDALQTIATQAQNGTLPDEAARLIPLANKRSGKDTKARSLSYDGMMKWWCAWNKHGKNPAALAPKDVEKLSPKAMAEWVRDYPAGRPDKAVLIAGIPEWLPYFLDEYRTPQKHSVAEVHRTLLRTLPPGIPRPSYDQLTRLVEKIPETYLQKGRMTGAEYKSILGYGMRFGCH